MFEPTMPPPGVLHGRRVGRPLRAQQKARVERVLPTLEIELPLAGRTTDLFGFDPTEIRLEIGFGGGEHLAAEALRQPEIGFIGCEPFRNGVAKMVDRIEALSLRNVRLFPDDAGRLLDALAARSIDRVDLLYPDPWPKRRQRKRRFVSDAMLERLAGVLRAGGCFRFATDIDDYAGWTLARILRSQDFVWTAEKVDAWRRPWPDWTPTRYEAKAIAEGRKPVYLEFMRR